MSLIAGGGDGGGALLSADVNNEGATDATFESTTDGADAQKERTNKSLHN